MPGYFAGPRIPTWLKLTNASETRNLRADFYSGTFKTIDSTFPDLSGSDDEERLICEHAIFRPGHLRANLFIREWLDASDLNLHRWTVDDETTRILSDAPRNVASS